MAVSSAFLGAKLEALLLSNTASSSVSASAGHVGLPASARARRAALIRKNWGMIRCEAAPDALAQADNVESSNAASFSASASSLSALEQLKTSAADSMNAFAPKLLLQFAIFYSN